MSTPQPPRPAPRPGLGFVLLGIALALGAGSCAKRPTATVLLANESFEVVVQPSSTDERGIFEWTVRHANQSWLVRSRIADLRSASSLGTPEARAVLERSMAWRAPYLFIREDTGHREGSRSIVDHVFKSAGGAVSRLGTLAAASGVPGDQFVDGRFRDLYDRLEFSPLATPEQGPVFPIVLRDIEGRFRVDTETTWDQNRALFEQRLEEFRGEQDATPSGPGAQRRAQARALFCLALTRYCNRTADFERALAMARRTLDPVEDLLQEVETVVPGELAASRDEILRANPALVNLFKESADETSEPEAPILPVPGAPSVGLPPSDPAL